MTDDEIKEMEAEAEALVDAALNGDPATMREVLESVDDEQDADSADDHEVDRPATSIAVRKRAGESDARAVARAAMQPEIHAALTSLRLMQQARNYSDDPDINELIAELEAQVSSVKSRELGRGEEMLVAQAHTLDEIFNNLVRRAALNMGQYLNAAESYLKLALRAQSQCRSTWEAISEIQNPRVAGYVKQAIIAHGHQQVNNGPARRKFRNRQTNFWSRQSMSQTNGSAEERRQRQRELIQRWKPWEKSTGPRTVEGKAKVAKNAYRGGIRRMLRNLARVLKEQQRQFRL